MYYIIEIIITKPISISNKLTIYKLHRTTISSINITMQIKRWRVFMESWLSFLFSFIDIHEKCVKKKNKKKILRFSVSR